MGIIWTMWDIKNVISVNVLDGSKYYLNHVGYKVATPRKTILGLLAGIIWTMWDIKSFASPANSFANLRIIWTMWDIKTRNVSSILLTLLGIIWTMWDIKASINWQTARANCFAGIIWTMWDIKLEVVPEVLKKIAVDVLSEPCGI